jgi:hypothetical protein
MLYLVADVPRARPFLDHISIEGLAKADAALILDRTRYAAAAVFPPDSGKRFQAAAWGEYPSFGAGLAFASAGDWKKRRSPAGPFWYSAERDISLAFNRAQAFAVLGPAEPEAGAGALPGAGPYPQGPGVPVPEGFSGFREDTCLALWMDEPAGPLDRFLGALRLPLRIPAEQLMAGVSPLPGSEPPLPALDSGALAPGGSEALYELKLRIKTPSEANARTLMTLFSTARLFISRTGNQGGTDQETIELLNTLFARPPEREGPYLKLRSAPLDGDRVALLFSLFSVYSGEN